jgi:hypothetical protein
MKRESSPFWKERIASGLPSPWRARAPDSRARGPQGGIVLSLEKFRRLEIRDAAAPSRQFFAPDPTEITCSIGGAIATKASGSRSFRYGSTRRGLVAKIRWQNELVQWGARM